MRKTIIAGALIGLLTVGVAAQGPTPAVVQQALRAFLAAANTWTGTQTFTNVVVNGSCTGCGGGGGGAPTDATYITQTPNVTLSAEQPLSAQATGIMRSATTTGVVSTLTNSAGIAANISDESGTGVMLFSGSPTIVTPTIASFANATHTHANAAGGGQIAIGTGLSGAGTGVLTALGINVGSAGAFVVNGGALGTPSSGTLTSATGLPISTGLTGAGTGVLAALGINIGSAGAPVLFNGAGGTPSAITLTNGTGLPIAGIASLGAGVGTWLATPSSANLASALTDETGTGLAVFGTSPTIVTPTIASFANATHNHSNAAGGAQLALSAFPATVFTTGIWTATLTNSANIDVSAFVGGGYYRVGDKVTVYYIVTVDAAVASTLTTLGVSLPIASNFAAGFDGAGSCYSPGAASLGAAVYADPTNDRLTFQLISTTNVLNQTYTCHATYSVI